MLSLFNFGDQLYGPCLAGVERARVQRLQNACLRFVYNIRRRSRISHTLNWAGWLSMSQRRYLHAATFYHKIILYKTPPYLYHKIQFRTDVHHINVRRRNAITIPQHKLQTFQRSFTYCVSSIYNDLFSLYSLSLNCFKRALRSRLMVG